MTEHRAFSTIAVKALDTERREFTGLATSPAPDRVDDVIEPLGVRYKNPLVLLRAHDHTMPIGEVFFDRPSKSGIGFRARIPTVTEPGLLKDRLDMSWGEIRHGLIKAVSIGFRAIEAVPLPTGGMRFTKTEVYELSTVAIPAQQLATIDQVKAIDAAVRRGEAPTMEAASPLWLSAVAAGKKGMDRTKGTDLYQRASGAQQTAMLAGDMSRSMIKMLCDRIEAIEARVSQSPMKYVGTWKAGQVYPPNSFCTHGGSVWFTPNATDRRPAEGADWVMAVRAGRDGKDARP